MNEKFVGILNAVVKICICNLLKAKSGNTISDCYDFLFLSISETTPILLSMTQTNSV